ncbi:MAG: histidine phosphatase family protein [Gaiellaceae bacterium]
MQLLLLTRHGQSRFNVTGTVNGDPALDLGLSELGVREGTELAQQIAALAIDLCVVSEFPRAQQTAALALGGREVPHVVDADLNDIGIGELEGRTLDDYRDWKRDRSRKEPFPGGESLDAAALRYADAYERALGRSEETIFMVCHEIPVRWAVNASAGSDEFDAPLHDVANATPYVFDEDGLHRAITRMRRLASSTAPV